jgi:MFS family permease
MNIRSSDEVYHPERLGFKKTAHAYNKTKVSFLALSGSLGGLCLGYNTCIAATALFLIEKQFPDVTATIRQLFISVVLISAAIGSIFGGILNDKIGRKGAILVSDVLLIFGPGILWQSASMKYLLIGRLLTGMGIGISILSSTLFLSESSPSALRGAMVASYQVMIALGTLLAFAFAWFPFNWNLMLGVGLIPAAL